MHWSQGSGCSKHTDNLAELVGAKAAELGEERLKQLGKEHTASFCASRKAVVCLSICLLLELTLETDPALVVSL